MSFFDEERPIRKTAHEIGQDLSILSVDDLDDRIALLRQEIARLEADRQKKQADRSAADNLFRK
jgi:uncharacterized small protein (DUF1192 family)